mmetsp:Transcript_59668/g.159665  ORF Transcript_59668/g.159665 Transcript_59668/m.159665 type:complete len:338 (+) Transcript_59668:2187-3200(+)
MSSCSSSSSLQTRGMYQRSRRVDSTPLSQASTRTMRANPSWISLTHTSDPSGISRATVRARSRSHSGRTPARFTRYSAVDKQGMNTRSYFWWKAVLPELSSARMLRILSVKAFCRTSSAMFSGSPGRFVARCCQSTHRWRNTGSVNPSEIAEANCRWLMSSATCDSMRYRVVVVFFVDSSMMASCSLRHGVRVTGPDRTASVTVRRPTVRGQPLGITPVAASTCQAASAPANTAARIVPQSVPLAASPGKRVFAAQKAPSASVMITGHWERARPLPRRNMPWVEVTRVPSAARDQMPWAVKPDWAFLAKISAQDPSICVCPGNHEAMKSWSPDPQML